MNRAILFLLGLVAGFAVCWGLTLKKAPPAPAKPIPAAAALPAAPPATPNPAPANPGPEPATAGNGATTTENGEPENESAHARKPSELDPRFVTFTAYNLRNYLKMERMGKGGVGMVPDQPKPEREVHALVDMIADIKPDMLGVCEIGTKDDLADLQKRLAEAGVNLPVAEWVDSADANRNLALLSKFPVVERHHRTDLTYQLGGAVLPYGRGILDATVEPAPGYRLRLVGTHLKSKREVEGSDQEEMRRNEAHLLHQHIDEILEAAPETNLMVYGDFNDIKNTAGIQELKGEKGAHNSLFDIYLKDRFGYTWTHYWSTGDQYSRIDYVMVSKAMLPEIQKRDCYIHSAPEWFAASDHRPLVIRLLPEETKAGKK